MTFQRLRGDGDNLEIGLHAEYAIRNESFTTFCDKTREPRMILKMIGTMNTSQDTRCRRRLSEIAIPWISAILTNEFDRRTRTGSGQLLLSFWMSPGCWYDCCSMDLANIRQKPNGRCQWPPEVCLFIGKYVPCKDQRAILKSSGARSSTSVPKGQWINLYQIRTKPLNVQHVLPMIALRCARIGVGPSLAKSTA